MYYLNFVLNNWTVQDDADSGYHTAENTLVTPTAKSPGEWTLTREDLMRRIDAFNLNSHGLLMSIVGFSIFSFAITFSSLHLYCTCFNLLECLVLTNFIILWLINVTVFFRDACTEACACILNCLWYIMSVFLAIVQLVISVCYLYIW